MTGGILGANRHLLETRTGTGGTVTLETLYGQQAILILFTITFLSPSLMTNSLILTASFGGKDVHLRRWLVVESSGSLLAEVFRNFSSDVKYITVYLCTAPVPPYSHHTHQKGATDVTLAANSLA